MHKKIHSDFFVKLPALFEHEMDSSDDEEFQNSQQPTTNHIPDNEEVGCIPVLKICHKSSAQKNPFLKDFFKRFEIDKKKNKKKKKNFENA